MAGSLRQLNKSFLSFASLHPPPSLYRVIPDAVFRDKSTVVSDLSPDKSLRNERMEVADVSEAKEFDVVTTVAVRISDTVQLQLFEIGQ